MPLHIEYIIPLAAGGTNDEENLWLACALCNGYKEIQREHLDPENRATVPLFNPRRQQWREHLAWGDGGVTIIGISAVGRATVIALQLNNVYLTRARRRWIMLGWHPPA